MSKVFTIPCATLTGEPGPAILWEDIPDGTLLGGLAPIGIPWAGKKYKGRRVADKPCPNGEFLVTHCMIDGVRVEVVS